VFIVIHPRFERGTHVLSCMGPAYNVRSGTDASYASNDLAVVTAIATATKPPAPPKTTDIGAPTYFASAPASNSPNCGPPIKNIMFTDVILPRNLSGVTSCRIVCLNTVLTVSDAPTIASITSDSAKLFDSPNPIVAAPYVATAITTLRP